MSPARDERRQAVIGLLATHGDVRWHDGQSAVTFADAVLELAQRLGRVETVPALRPVRVATDAERMARMSAIRAVLGRPGNGTDRPRSASEGERAHGDGTAARRGSQGDSGGRA